MILDRIQKENDIKQLNNYELEILAKEIRQFLIERISETGGHLASNLGVVELTMALHLVFDLPEDHIIWDVGHQSYTHKILTGRHIGFDSLRKYGGICGFPKRSESECDAFNTGHSSTSVSAGLGLAKARDLQHKKNHVISVFGDGAMTGGMVYEALNNAAQLKTKFIMVLNDNNMSISKNVGGISTYLNKLRTTNAYHGFKTEIAYLASHIPVYGVYVADKLKKAKNGMKQLVIPDMFFEDMGITYLGPVDGHNIKSMTRAFKEAEKLHTPVLVHVVTKKGKGYAPAQKNPERYHGAEPFVIETGKPKKKKMKSSYTDVFAEMICRIGERNSKVVAITAAMADGTGLKKFRNRFRSRFFDVGIAEEHGVTFAAGMAAGGLVPVVAIYSSFLQRGYDQIIHDVCIQNLPVVFAIDRAGLVGSDGETHQGIFDLSYLSGIPNMHIMAPKNKWELADMLKFAVDFGKPIAVRYPRGEAYEGLKEYRAPISCAKSEILFEEEDIFIMAVGSMVKSGEEVRRRLKEIGYNCSLVNARFVKPFDEELIAEFSKDHKLLVTLEENVKSGGFGEAVLAYVSEAGLDIKVLPIAISDEYVEHGNVDILIKEVGLDSDSIVKKIIPEYIGVQEKL